MSGDKYASEALKLADVFLRDGEKAFVREIATALESVGKESVQGFIDHHHNPIVGTLNKDIKALEKQLSEKEAEAAQLKDVLGISQKSLGEMKLYHHNAMIRVKELEAECKLRLKEVEESIYENRVLSQKLEEAEKTLKQGGFCVDDAVIKENELLTQKLSASQRKLERAVKNFKSLKEGLIEDGYQEINHLVELCVETIEELTSEGK
jgi:hypothetical protein